ncbi:MAG TPA: class A beta-lactamase [Syntrophales bacterium]|nr:class A beta-lactamase [Syntrophales bacterium]
MRRNRVLIFSLLLAMILVTGRSFAWAKDTQGSASGAVMAEIGRIGMAAKGTVGLAAIHLETGHRVDSRADEFFPMASTVKVAVAAKILDMADKGQISLTTPISLEQSEMAPDGPLGDIRWRPGLSYPASDLLELMIATSDNTSTDVLFRVAGGPAAAHAWLQGLGLQGIRPSRFIRELLRDVLSIPGPASPTMSLAEQFRKMSPKQAAERRAKAYRASPAYDADLRDQASPNAMLGLLCKIWLAEGISREARSALLSVMERSTTGLKRIRGRLPAGTVVADKTGTLAGSVNDVGYVTLPDGKGHIAIAVFVKGSEAPLATRETVIADISRLLYDYFLISSR